MSETISIFNSFLQFVIFGACTAVLLFFFRFTKYRLSEITIPSIFFLWFLLQIWMGFPIIFAGLSRYNIEFVDQMPLYIMLISSALGILCILMGVSLVNIRKVKIKAELEKPGSSFQYKIAFLLLTISSIMVYFYLSSLKQIPFLALLSGEYSQEGIGRFRSDATSGYGGKLFYYNMFTNGLIPFLSYYFLALYLIMKRRLFGLFWILSFILSIISTLFSAAKAPVVLYLFNLIILWAIVRQKELKWRWVVATLILGIGIVTLLYASLTGFYFGFWESLSHMLNRAAVGQLRPAYYYVMMFPEKVNYLMGQSFGIPSVISPFDKHYILPVEVMNFIHPGLYTASVGRANTIYWGEIYANFGFFAIPFFSILIGIYMGIIQRIFERKINPLNAALFVFFMSFFMDLIYSGVSGILPFNTKFIIVIISASLLYMARNFYPFKTHTYDH